MMFFHEESPKKRDLQLLCQEISNDKVIACPSGSGYCLLIKTGSKSALDGVKHLRYLEKHHLFTMFCSDLSQISKKTIVDDPCYRLLRKNTPSVCTFVLKASKEVSREILHPKRKTIGIRVPVEPILMAILQTIGEPLLSVSLQRHDEELNTFLADDVADRVGDKALVVDIGKPCPVSLSTVVDCTTTDFNIIRQGEYILGSV